MSTELIFADYSNSQHRKDLVELLNTYATDPMGGEALCGCASIGLAFVVHAGVTRCFNAKQPDH